MTATSTSRATVRRLPRRVPVPVSEPPYDDDRDYSSEGQPVTQGTLALDLASTATEPAIEPTVGAGVDTRSAARHLSVVRSRKRQRDSEDVFFAPQPTPRVALPDPKSWSGRFVQAVVEILSGDRPAAQLLRWTDERVYAEVIGRVRTLGSPVTATTRSGRGRALVRSVHVCEPRDGVAEAAVHVRHGGRSRAVAIRLEGLDGRWRCTALQLG